MTVAEKGTILPELPKVAARQKAFDKARTDVMKMMLEIAKRYDLTPAEEVYLLACEIMARSKERIKWNRNSP